MKNTKLTIREIMEEINTKLQENWNKEVIKLGYRDFDTTNGRKVISIDAVTEMVSSYFYGTSLSIISEKRTIKFYKGTDLSFSVKCKKSDIIDNWDYNNKMTCVELIINNESYLDRNIQYFIDEYNNKKQEENNIETKEYEDFKNTMEKVGITLEQLKSLYQTYRNLSYEYRDKAENEI